MRVISGKAKGQPLKSLDGRNTRPTTDRIKESMFNLVQQRVYGKAVLDLFSGSGALGIEALSRGAESCSFVDNDKGSIRIIKSNLEKTRLMDTGEVYLGEYKEVLAKLKKQSKSFDLVFLDPPYGKELVKQSIFMLLDRAMLNQRALVVTEQGVKESPLEVPEPLVLWKERCYGNTVIRIYEHT